MAIEARFSELGNNKNEIEAELHRLEGEHRIVTDLLAAVANEAQIEVKHVTSRIRKAGQGAPDKVSPQ